MIAKKIKFLIFLSVILVCCDENKNSKSLDNEFFLELDNLIIGTWTNQSYSHDFYDFYENRIWRHTSYDYKKDTIITKGRYIIDRDSAIFLRHFGTRHWPNTDTITDNKTSLGGEVLFLNKYGNIIDNEEDYELIYIKD